jgi:hypothetical protein
MILSIHQPHFLPWLGYFNKIAASDTFLFLDTVQFTKNYFQNRTLIKSIQNTEIWLTIPVKKANLETPIYDISISEVYNPDLIINKIQTSYHKTIFFKDYSDDIFGIIKGSKISLSELNIELTKYILNLLGIKTNVLISSQLPKVSDDPNLRLIEYCQLLQANTYLAGKGGKNYMNLELFEKNGISVVWQDFRVVEVVYPQLGNPFLPSLSILDALFNVGKSKVVELIVNEKKY